MLVENSMYGEYDPGGVVCDSDKYSINGCIYNCEINFVSNITSLIQ